MGNERTVGGSGVIRTSGDSIKRLVRIERKKIGVDDDEEDDEEDDSSGFNILFNIIFVIVIGAILFFTVTIIFGSLKDVVSSTTQTNSAAQVNATYSGLLNFMGSGSFFSGFIVIFTIVFVAIIMWLFINPLGRAGLI